MVARAIIANKIKKQTSILYKYAVTDTQPTSLFYQEGEQEGMRIANGEEKMREK